jgi:hypothetical protein
MRIECSPGSALPDDLRGARYVLEADGEGERILPMAIIEQFSRNTGGELMPITAGSTVAVAEVRHHAGITRVQRFSLGRFSRDETASRHLPVS